jgi:hypothetical protein
MHILENFLENANDVRSRQDLNNFFKSITHIEIGGNKFYDGTGSHWMQNPNEFIDLILFLNLLQTTSDFKIKNFCEIGFSSGITHTILTKIFNPDSSIAVDVVSPAGICADTFMANLRFKNLTYFAMNSQSDVCLKSVSKFAPFDLIFIDGDHSSNGSSLDFFNYLPFLSQKGVIVMHDIYAQKPCEVNFTWDKIKKSNKFECFEFYDDSVKIPYGLGLVVNEIKVPDLNLHRFQTLVQT